MEFNHYSVMLAESITALDIKPDGIYVDCTCGGGGHSYAIADRLTTGRLVAIDRDSDALEAAQARLSAFSSHVTFLHSNFCDASQALTELGIEKIDGAIADLGVSSYQLDCAERGFSYMHDAPLDMRMDKGAALTAYDVVNGYSEEDIKRVLYNYGEESFAPKIARAIVTARKDKPIASTFELVEIIKAALPEKVKATGHHPAKKTFQAIRIEVNDELNIIEPTLRSLAEKLNPGGRLAVITFHSLEDRITKHTFASLAKGCTCPPDFPVCVCGKKPEVKIITRKPIEPSEKELEENPRSRSAKLRVAEKL